MIHFMLMDSYCSVMNFRLSWSPWIGAGGIPHKKLTVNRFWGSVNFCLAAGALSEFTNKGG